MGRDVQAGSEGAVLGTQVPLWTQLGTFRAQSREGAANCKGSLGIQNFPVSGVWETQRMRLSWMSSGPWEGRNEHSVS